MWFYTICLKEKNNLRFIACSNNIPDNWLTYFDCVGKLLPAKVEILILKKQTDDDTTGTIEPNDIFSRPPCESLFLERFKKYKENISLLPRYSLEPQITLSEFKELLPLVLYESLFGMNVWFRKNVRECFSEEIFLGQDQFSFVIFKYDLKKREAFCKVRTDCSLVDLGEGSELRQTNQKIWTSVSFRGGVDSNLIEKHNIYIEPPSLQNLIIGRIVDSPDLFKKSLTKLPELIAHKVKSVWVFGRRFKLESTDL